MNKLKVTLFLPQFQVYYDLSPVFKKLKPLVKDLPNSIELLEELYDLLQVLYTTEVDPDIVEKHSKIIKQLKKGLKKCRVVEENSSEH